MACSSSVTLLSLLSLALIGLGCTAPGRAPSLPTRLEPTAAAPPQPSPEPSPAPAVQVEAPSASQPTDPTLAIGQQLAELWCRQGFGWPDATRPPCSAAHVRVSNRHTVGALESAVYDLSVSDGGFAEARYVQFRTAKATSALMLAQAWSAGVGGFSHEIVIEGARFEDVYADTAPEWLAEVEVETHDSDMGICRIQGSVERSLVLCTNAQGELACLKLPIMSIAYDEIVTGSSPAVGCAAPRHDSVGYALNVNVARDFIELTPKKKSELAWPSMRAKKPPFQGKVSIEKLLRRARADVVTL